MAKGARGDEPELERWQSIDLVGFTVSFYLSLSFYISASPASLHTSYGGASALTLFQGFDFLPSSGYKPRAPSPFSHPLPSLFFLSFGGKRSVFRMEIARIETERRNILFFLPRSVFPALCFWRTFRWEMIRD